MAILIAGLLLFLGAHLVPTVPALRAGLVARLGPQPYRLAFSLISGAGLVLIIFGYRAGPEGGQLFAPLAGARMAAPLLVTVAFVLFAAANMNTHIRRILRHPMLLGLMLWSGVHLLANGDRAGSILFGSFLAYSVIDLAAAVSQGRVRKASADWRFDMVAIVLGVAASYLAMRYHAGIFNTGPVV